MHLNSRSISHNVGYLNGSTFCYKYNFQAKIELAYKYHNPSCLSLSILLNQLPFRMSYSCKLFGYTENEIFAKVVFFFAKTKPKTNESD